MEDNKKSPQVAGTTSEDSSSNQIRKNIKGITIDLSNHDIQPKGTMKNWLKKLLKNLFR